MPVAVLHKYAKESGKSLQEVESYWDEAKKQADKKFDGKKDEHYWAYVHAIVKRRCGLDDEGKRK